MRRCALPARWIALGLCLAGCRREPVVGDARALVVVVSVDTLGLAMADRTGWCEHLGGLLGDYGLTVGCLRGGVAPSSWTAESHTRFLWPQHAAGDLRARQSPECGRASVLGTFAGSTRGKYVWGSDNLVLSEGGWNESCEDGGPFTQGTDDAFETDLDVQGLADVPEEDRPVKAAIDAYERALRRDRSVALFLNPMEAGGHQPRCWTDPETPACEELWDVAVAGGLAAEDADRVEAWLDKDFYEQLLQLVTVRHPESEARWRELFWATIEENVLAFRGPMVDDRLRRVLDATEEAGRLDDLRLVVLGDHGENPCVLRGHGDETLNCGHNGLTTEFTGYVPVFVSPADLGGDFVGDEARPWSTVNLAYALLDDVAVPIPDDWGPMEPVGTATSWTCSGPFGTSSGVHVEGDQSIRCIGGVCSTSDFAIPADETHVPTPLDGVSESVASYGVAPDWFGLACREDEAPPP